MTKKTKSNPIPPASQPPAAQKGQSQPKAGSGGSAGPRMCYTGRCPRGCVTMISTVPEPGESRVLRESAATFLAEAVLGGQRVALEEFDVVRAEPHFMKCMAEQPTPGTPTNPSATPLPCPLDGVHDGIPKGYEVRVVLTPDQPTLDDLDGEVKVYEFPDPTRPHAPDDGVAGAVEGLVRVARSIAAGDGVWDRDDLARALLNLSEVERNGSGQGSC